MEIITKNNEAKKYILIGIISTSHGLDGKMKFKSYSEDIKKYENIYIKNNGIYKKIKIEFVEKVSKENYIIKIEDVKCVEDTYMYKGKKIYINKNDLEKIDDTHYYISDILEIEAFDENNLKLGKITDVITTGMQETFIIQMKNKEIAIPNQSEYIIKIDINKKEAYFNIQKLRKVFDL